MPVPSGLFGPGRSALVRAGYEPAKVSFGERTQLAQETAAAQVEIAARLTSLQAQAEQAPRTEAADLVVRSEKAAQQIDLDEAETRALIETTQRLACSVYRARDEHGARSKLRAFALLW